MSFTTRDLLARVRMLRSDIANDSPANLCINEAVRSVCRETRLAKTVTDTTYITAGDTDKTMTTTLGDVLHVSRVFMADVPKGNYRGTVAITTGVITPTDGAKTVVTGSANTFTSGDFWIVSATSTTAVDDSEESWAVGDVVYSNGTNFVQTKKKAFKAVHVVNIEDEFSLSLSPKGNLGSIHGISSHGDRIEYFTSPKYDDAIYCDLAYVPGSEVVSGIPLPQSAEECVLNAAIAMYYMLPGEQQDKTSAQEYRRKSKLEMANLLLVGELGGDGMPHMNVPDFFGRPR